MDKLKAATVHCNTPDLLVRAIKSIREFYPQLGICVVDNSTKAHKEVEEFEQEEMFLRYIMGGNVGHGPAMDWAINNLDAEYLLLFDTDIIMKKPCLEKMLPMFDKDTFGVGEVNYEPQELYHVRFGDGSDKIPVLHPYFHIVQTKVYRKFLPYIQNGGPCFLTALDIFSSRKTHILKNFPVRDYIEHSWRGTRDVRPPNMFKDSVVLNEKHMKRFRENWNG
jgi:hypothetical protein